MRTDSLSAASILREARLKAQLSQSELACRANVAQSVISAYEAGRREPAFSTLARLVEASGHRMKVELELSDGAIRGLPNTPMGRRIRRNRSKLLAVVARHGVTNLRVFGSVVRGTDHSQSDVDMVVDVPIKMGLFKLGELERELSDVVGAHVDLVPSDGLRPRVRSSIEAEAIPV